MSESGVIPRPEDRPPYIVGSLKDADGLMVNVGVDGRTVTIASWNQPIHLDAAGREEFSRLYFEAERQAEATGPQCKTCLGDGWIEVGDGPGYRTEPCPEGCEAGEVSDG